MRWSLSESAYDDDDDGGQLLDDWVNKINILSDILSNVYIVP